jgi:hypothetical protein
MKSNIKKCINWCIKNGVEYNTGLNEKGIIENSERNIFMPVAKV